MRGQGAGQQTWDRAFFAVMFVMFVAWLALMALDAVRWRWSYLPLWLQAAGAVVLLGSFALFFATFHANTFLSPVVRIQAERGQTVISDGPYRHVRHPMYTAFLLFAVGTTLLLGSLWGLAGAAALTALVATRALLEERTLRRELPGYAEYMERVRYRLVPGLW
ncbi:MAG: isoprenylcysteine carboxylmethyltransferase family protein [Dehalococcoidia bacterium]